MTDYMLSTAVLDSADGAPLSSCIQPVTECHQSLFWLLNVNISLP